MLILDMFLMAGLAVNKMADTCWWHTINTVSKNGVWLSHTKQILVLDKISIVSVHMSGFNKPTVQKKLDFFGTSEKWDSGPKTFGGIRDQRPKTRCNGELRLNLRLPVLILQWIRTPSVLILWWNKTPSVN